GYFVIDMAEGTSVTFEITASAEVGGAISPSGAVTVIEGSSQEFTITPDAGYVIQDVVVDGASQGAVTSYTFNNVSADHTIEATFQPEVGTPPAAPSDLVLTVVSQTRIDLSWTDNADNEDGFRVYRNTSNSKPTDPISTQTAETYGDEGLSSGTTYYYWVEAYNSDGVSSSITGTATTQEQIGTNLLTNGDMENGQTGWYAGNGTTLATVSSPVRGGSAAMSVSGGNNWGGMVQDVTDLLNTFGQGDYDVSAWLRAESGTASYRIQFKINGQWGPAVDQSCGTSYVESSGSLSVSWDGALTTAEFWILKIGHSTGFYADDVTLTGGSVGSVPSAPSDLALNVQSSSQIDLTWSDNADTEDGFSIERAAGAGSFEEIATVSADAATYADNGLVESTEYLYRVRAYNGAGYSSYSNEVSATTQSGVAPPADGDTIYLQSAFNDLYASALSTSDTVSVDASNISDAERFVVTVNGDNSYSFKNVGTASLFQAVGGYDFYVRTNGSIIGNEDKWLLEINADGTISLQRSDVNAYITIVDAVDNLQASASTNDTDRERFYWGLAGEVAGGAPTAPSDLGATAQSVSRIELVWTDNASSEDGYSIERMIAGGDFAEVATVGPDVTAYTDAGLSEYTEYFYRIRAYNASGYSAYSNETSATTLIAATEAPSDLTVLGQTLTSIDITWTDNASSEAGFSIERKPVGGTFEEVATVAADVISYSDQDLYPARQFVYRVRGYTSSSDLGYSNELETSTDGFTTENLVPWLESLPWETEPWNAGQQIVTYDTDIEAGGADVVALLFTWLADNQKADGYWGAADDEYDRVGCVLKLSDVYKYFAEPMPRADDVYEKTLDILNNEPTPNSYPLLSDVIRVLNKLENQGDLTRTITDTERLNVVTTIMNYMKEFQKDDGGFSNMLLGTAPTMGTSSEAKLTLGLGLAEGSTYATYMTWSDRERLYTYAQRTPPAVDPTPLFSAIDDPSSVSLIEESSEPLSPADLDEAMTQLDQMLAHNSLVFMGRMYDTMTGGFFAMPSAKTDPFLYQPILHITGNVILMITDEDRVNALSQLPESVRLGMVEFWRMREDPNDGLHYEVETPYGDMRTSPWWVDRVNSPTYIAGAFESIDYNDVIEDFKTYIWIRGIEEGETILEDTTVNVWAYDGNIGSENGQGIDRVEFSLVSAGGATVRTGTVTAQPYTFDIVTSELTDGGEYTLTATAYATAEAGSSERSADVVFSYSSTPVAGDHDPAHFEAELHDAQNGVETYTTTIGYVDNGDWLRFDAMDLGAGFDSIRAYSSRGQSGSTTCEVRLGSVDGTLIATITTNSTGAWGTYQLTAPATVSGGTGITDVYIVFQGAANYDYFEFFNAQ
ncbi:MAG: carbohydrate-binding protein, partial [Chitinivibrionales bacterium]|nr:carbohydrate-binding protein [Chitinivibrionales bacterium]